MLRIGIVGIGFMGGVHVCSFTENPMIKGGTVKNGKLVAVCDINPERLKWAAEKVEGVLTFLDYKEMIASGEIDAVIIATPHYLHPLMGIEALKKNLHILVEKPIGVYTKNVEELIELSKSKSDLQFGLIFNQRTNPLFIKAKEIIDEGGIGTMKRMNWIITNWYRPQKYYDSGSWRGTWGGEGGGVLMNQAPHQIDLWQWLCGMPIKVKSYCKFGKNRNVEIETDVTTYVEYADGGSGVFVTSVHDVPGTNRLEMIGDKGQIVIEGDKIKYIKLEKSEVEMNQTSTANLMDPNNIPKLETVVYGKEELGDVPFGVEHALVIENFIDCIDGKAKLIAPGEEGIKALELINAMLLSSFIGEEVSIPLDKDFYYSELMKKCEKSVYKDKWMV
ncbi:MAG: Gfo/Idh/MocA family protein [Fusobacteriaceae bacterium]